MASKRGVALILQLLFSLLTLIEAMTGPTLHGRFRPEVDDAVAPLCGKSDVFQFSNRTMHTGIWKIIGEDPRDPAAVTSFHAGDALHGQCKIAPISRPQALECLRGRNIIMIGDSLTRYQYEALIWWLERGEETEPEFRSMSARKKAPFLGAAGCGGFEDNPLRCDMCRSKNLTSPQVDNKYYSSRGVNVTLFGLYNYAAGRLPIGMERPRIGVSYTLVP